MKYNSFFLVCLIMTSVFEEMTPKYVFDFSIKDEKDNFSSPLSSHKMKSFLEAEIESTMDTRTTMKVCIGTPAQCFDLTILTNSFYILVNDINSKVQESKNKFDYSKSSTIVRNSKEIRLNYYGQRIIGTEAKDVISLGNEELSRVSFLIVQSSGRFRKEDGFIGLGYTPSNDEKKFSIIQQLFDNGDIPHKVFSQKYTNDFNGKITIGEIPKYIVEDYSHYGRCKALDKIRKGEKYKNNNWECGLSYIYFGSDMNKKKDFDNKEKVSFLSYRKRSFMPKTIFDYVGKVLFDKAISENKCTLKQSQRYDFYECEKDVEIETLSLIFDDWEIKIDSSKLFEKEREDGKKEFIFYHKDEYEILLIGRSLLKEFEMVYDYANKEIGFYHPSVKYLGKEKVSPPKVYQFLEDDEEYNPKKIENGPSLIPTVKPEEIRKNNQDDIEDTSPYMLVNLLKKILELAISIIGILILIFIIFYVIRYRKKSKAKKAIDYMKKERMLEARV